MLHMVWYFAKYILFASKPPGTVLKPSAKSQYNPNTPQGGVNNHLKKRGDCDTVDGGNPAPPGMYKTLKNNELKLPTSTGEFTGFLAPTVDSIPSHWAQVFFRASSNQQCNAKYPGCMHKTSAAPDKHHCCPQNHEK